MRSTSNKATAGNQWYDSVNREIAVYIPGLITLMVHYATRRLLTREVILIPITAGYRHSRVRYGPVLFT